MTRTGDGTSATEQQVISVTASASVSSTARTQEGYYRLRFTHDRGAPQAVRGGRNGADGRHGFATGDAVFSPVRSQMLRSTAPYYVLKTADTFSLHDTPTRPIPTVTLTLTPATSLHGQERYCNGCRAAAGQQRSACTNATATEMQEALETLPQVARGHVRVSRTGSGRAADGFGYT